MALNHVLRVARDDAEQQFALLNVSQSTQNSFDLTIEGTDGESPFVGNVRQSRLQELLVKKNSVVSLSEWEAILSWHLLQNGPLLDESESLANVEVAAKVSRDEMAIIFRRNISGIHQRIGAIPLKKDDQHEIDVVSWLSTVLTRAASLEQQVRELTQKLNAHEHAADKLKTQLDQFQDAKRTDETTLLDKFCSSLNHKKEKIRDLTALLTDAKVNKVKAEQISAARASLAHHEPSICRKQKRKSSQPGSPSGSDFEAMDMDMDKENPQSDDEISRENTPEKDWAGEMDFGPDHDDSDDLAAGTTTSGDGKPEPKGHSHRPQGEDSSKHSPVLDSVPLKRDLPFLKKGGTQQDAAAGTGSTPQAPVANQAEDDEMSDDEL